MPKYLNQTIIALLIFSLLCALNSPVLAERLDPVKNLSVSHQSERGKVRVKWKKVANGQNYRVIILDSSNDKIEKSKTSKRKKSFSDESFTEGAEYTVKVKALKANGYSASKVAKITYTHGTDTGTPASSKTGSLNTTNSSGRSGSYYLPGGYNLESLPVMIAFHGTGGSGSDMVNAFSDLAEQYKFILVAPSSRKSPGGQFTWEVGTQQNEVTPDYTHALDCLDELLSKNNVSGSATSRIAIGYSGGGSSAPYLATNEFVFTHFASLHGGVFTGGLGSNVTAGWFSTGTNDTQRTPIEVQGYATSLPNLGFADVEYHEYSGGHSLGNNEKEEMVRWWLGR